MAELRKDSIVERWVIIAEDRAGRPHEYVDTPVVSRGEACPFCEGSEAQTPGEITSLRSPHSHVDGPGWRVRVVTNKFPALDRPTAWQEPADGLASAECRPAAGIHEVIVESPRHAASAADLSVEQTTEVLQIYRERLQRLKLDGRIRYVQIFKNVGEAAGASIEHLHSQLMALQFVPPLVAEEIAAARAYRAAHDRCVYCDLLDRELESGKRVVEADDEFTVWCPFASRFPFELWLAPRRHAAAFESLSDAGIAAAGVALRRALVRLEGTAEIAAYNYVLHTAPFDSSHDDHYHWHMEILPRSTKAAGFEWGTGVHINPVSPERAAEALRKANPE